MPAERVTGGAPGVGMDRIVVHALCGICLAYPWLNPLAGGPSTSVQPWLASAACAALLVALCGWARPRWPLALWLAFAALGAAAAWLPALDAFAAVGGVALVLAAAGLAPPRSHDDFARTITLAWLSAAVASSVLALLQYFDAAAPLAPFASVAAAGEAYGNLRQRNQFATLTAIGFAALLWLVATGWPWRRCALPLVLLAAAGAATASRTGAVEWIALAAFAATSRGSRRTEVAIAAAAGIVVFSLAAFSLPTLLYMATGIEGRSVFERFAQEAGCSSRRVLWSNVVHLIAQRPWTGWGWGELDFAHYMTLYPGLRFCDILDNAHSLPLHLAVELGLPVAVLACAGLLWALVRIAPWREADPTRRLALGVLLVILAHSLLEYPLWYGPFQIAFGLALGLLWGPRQAVSAARANACAVAAAIALAAVAYAAWDYHRISQIYMAPEARDPDYRGDPLPKLRESRLFRAQVQFAELTITPLTPANARWTYDTALAMLHYSPEPRIIEKLVESATLLGEHEAAAAHLARYRAAFPREHADWARR